MRVLRWLAWWRPPCLLQRVSVNFTHTGDEAIEGVLWRYRGGWLVIREPVAMRTGHEPKPLMIESVVIPRDRVAFLEVLR